VTAAGQGQKAKALVEASLGFLAGTTKESSQAVLATRSAARPPVILSPRNGRVLPEALAFEWLGSRFNRYTVRLVGPSGPVVDRREVTGPRWEYPADAPALGPNVREGLLHDARRVVVAALDADRDEPRSTAAGGSLHPHRPPRPLATPTASTSQFLLKK
jgi:hypothetical protein